jgi:hypothetical protein
LLRLFFLWQPSFVAQKPPEAKIIRETRPSFRRGPDNREGQAERNLCGCSAVSEFPERMPIFFTAFSRRVPAAKSG